MRTIELYLDDIIEKCAIIGRYVAEAESEAVFVDKQWLRDGIRVNLIDIGEASSKIPDELRAQYAEIDWRRVVAFRNVLTHEYFGLDWRIVWISATEYIPLLQATAMKMLAFLESASDDSQNTP